MENEQEISDRALIDCAKLRLIYKITTAIDSNHLLGVIHQIEEMIEKSNMKGEEVE